MTKTTEIESTEFAHESRQIAYTTPDGSLVQRFVEKIEQQADAVVVSSNEEYETAGAFLKAMTGEEKRLEAERTTAKKPILEAGRAIDSMFKPFTDRIKAARDTVKGKMKVYYDEQEAIARRERAAAEEKARKEREKLEERAQKHREKGNEEKADALEVQAATTQATVPATAEAQPEATGVQTRMVWAAEIVDAKAAAKAVGDGIIPPKCIKQWDTTFMANQAKAFDGDLEWPGVKFTSTRKVVG